MQRWLRWLTDAELAESIAGDLEEERRRRAVRSRSRARLWFWRRAFAIAAYMLGQRVRAVSGGLLTHGVAHLGSFTGDVRHAARSLRRTPWYAFTVIGVVALSVSLAATVFAVVDGVLFKPLPYPGLDDLVAIEGGWASRPQMLGNISASPSDLVVWRTAAPEVRFTGYSAGGREQLDAGEPARAAWVAENFFDVLGQQPLVGGFRPEHFAMRTAIQPAVITYPCWQRRFSGDPSVVGRVIRGDRGSIVEVVGILPTGFLYPSTNGRLVPEVLIPLIEGVDWATDRGRGVTVFARMPAGMSTAALQDRLTPATLALARRYPRRPDERGLGPFDVMRVRPLEDTLRAASRQTFTTVFVTAAALVLLACLNVTGLSAARVQDRRRELTLRRALGCRSSDLVRLLGAESVVIVVLGGAAGVLAAFVLVQSLAAFLPEGLVLFKPLAVDARVVAFAGTGVGCLCRRDDASAGPGDAWRELASGARRVGRHDSAAAHVRAVRARRNAGGPRAGDGRRRRPARDQPGARVGRGPGLPRRPHVQCLARAPRRAELAAGREPPGGRAASCWCRGRRRFERAVSPALDDGQFVCRAGRRHRRRRRRESRGHPWILRSDGPRAPARAPADRA